MELKTPPIAKNLRNHTSEILAEHPQDAFGHKGRSDKDLEFLISRDLPADLRSKPQIHAIHAQPLPEGRSQLRNQPVLCLSYIMRFEHRNLQPCDICPTNSSIGYLPDRCSGDHQDSMSNPMVYRAGPDFRIASIRVKQDW